MLHAHDNGLVQEEALSRGGAEKQRIGHGRAHEFTGERPGGACPGVAATGAADRVAYSGAPIANRCAPAATTAVCSSTLATLPGGAGRSVMATTVPA